MVSEKILSVEQKKRRDCMYDFLQYLNRYTYNYILKGDTALMFHSINSFRGGNPCACTVGGASIIFFNMQSVLHYTSKCLCFSSD